MLCLSPEGILVDVNQSFLDLTGRSREEVLGQHYSTVTTPASAADNEAYLQHLREGETIPPVYEQELLQSDGRGICVEARTRLINTKGDLFWVLTILRDITERKQMEARLRESEARHRRLFDHAYDGMMCFTREGMITRVNMEFAKLLGRSRQELVGQHYRAFTTPSSVALHEDRQQRYRAGEKLPPSYELEVIRKDGSRLILEGRTKPVPVAEGQPREILGIYRDITERKRVEEALSRTHRQIG